MLLPESEGGGDRAGGRGGGSACSCSSAESWPGDSTGQGSVFRADTNCLAQACGFFIALHISLGSKDSRNTRELHLH